MNESIHADIFFNGLDVKIKSVLSKYKYDTVVEGNSYLVSIGDIYSEEVIRSYLHTNKYIYHRRLANRISLL